jgi:hypothetical protein
MDRFLEGVCLVVTGETVILRDTATGSRVELARRPDDGSEELEPGDDVVVWLMDDVRELPS